jgi:hypothetical protein
MEQDNVVDVQTTQEVAAETTKPETMIGVNVFFENAEAALANIRNASIFVEAAGISADKVDSKIATRQFLGAIYNAIEKGLNDEKEKQSLEATAPIEGEVATETTVENN